MIDTKRNKVYNIFVKICVNGYNKMAKYKIVCSDLDGTLLGLDMTVSEENRAAIRKMSELGVAFVASSGRTLHGFPRDVLENADIRYLSASNGAVIYDKKLGAPIYTKYIPKKISDQMFDILWENNALIFPHIDGKMWGDMEKASHEIYAAHRMSSYFESYINAVGNFVNDFKAFCKRASDVEMVSAFFPDDESLMRCTEALRKAGDYTLASSAKYNLEIFYAKAGKGNALSEFARLMQIDIKETIAVGDSTNDMSMIEAAGLGLAMGNAFAELKEAADEVICSYDGHSAKYILEHYIL